MSLWQRPHASLVRKKSAGMMPSTLVFADDGKKGLSGPAPSSCMVAGGSVGLTMRWARRHSASVALRTNGAATAASSATARPARNARTAAPLASHASPSAEATLAPEATPSPEVSRAPGASLAGRVPGGRDPPTAGARPAATRHRCAASSTAPTTITATWATRIGRWARDAPTTITPTPSRSPIALTPRPAAQSGGGVQRRRSRMKPATPARARPSRGWSATFAKYQSEALGSAAR